LTVNLFREACDNVSHKEVAPCTLCETLYFCWKHHRLHFAALVRSHIVRTMARSKPVSGKAFGAMRRSDKTDYPVTLTMLSLVHFGPPFFATKSPSFRSKVSGMTCEPNSQKQHLLRNLRDEVRTAGGKSPAHRTSVVHNARVERA